MRLPRDAELTYFHGEPFVRGSYIVDVLGVPVLTFFRAIMDEPTKLHPFTMSGVDIFDEAASDKVFAFIYILGRWEGASREESELGFYLSASPIEIERRFGGEHYNDNERIYGSELIVLCKKQFFAQRQVGSLLDSLGIAPDAYGNETNTQELLTLSPDGITRNYKPCIKWGFLL